LPVNLDGETDIATLQQAVRLLEQENRKLIRLNLELKQALLEARGEQAEQLELQIAALQETLASRNRALFGDSSERRAADDTIANVEQPAKDPQVGHGPRQQELPMQLDVALDAIEQRAFRRAVLAVGRVDLRVPQRHRHGLERPLFAPRVE
jgi:hypothetical protein